MTPIEAIRAAVETGRALCHRRCFQCSGGTGCDESRWREAALKMAEWLDRCDCYGRCLCEDRMAEIAEGLER